MVTYPTLQSFVTNVLGPSKYLTPVAYAERLSGRFVPRNLFASNSTRQSVANAIVSGLQIRIAESALMALTPAPFQIYSTGPPKTISGADTGVNTAWRTELWEVVYNVGWIQGTPAPLKELAAKAVHDALEPLRNITPGGGC